MELIFAVVMPFVVKYGTTLIKGIGPIPMLGYRVLIARAIVAVLSLAGAVLTVIVGDMPGGSIDPSLVETAVLTVINAAVATGLYLRSNK